MPTAVLRRRATTLLAGAVAAASLGVSLPASYAAAPRLPDLRVVTPVVDRASVVEGGTLTVSYRVANAGKARSGASHARFYLTRDPAASLAARRASRTNPRTSPTDLALVTVRATPAVTARGRTGVTKVTVGVPLGVAPGRYRLLVCADDRGAVRESLETDNCTAAARAVAVTPAPGASGLQLEQFTDTATWPADEARALEWMKLFCRSTYPVRSFTTASALASVEAFLRSTAGAPALTEVATSGLADDAAESQALAAAAMGAGSPGLALAAMLRARRFEPTVASHLLNVAALATSVGLPNEGLALLDGLAALDARPGPLGLQPSALAATVRGQALAMTGRLGPARSAFTAARVAEPLLSEADAGLAVVEACSGNDAKAVRFARLARQRTTTPRPAAVDPTGPLPSQPEPTLDLSRGVLTPLRQLPVAETPAQGVAMRDRYYAIEEAFGAEIDADNAEEDAIRQRLRAADELNTRAERMRRDDIVLLAHVDDAEAERLQRRLWAKIDVITELREEFFGGGTGEVPYRVGELISDAGDACAGAKDFDACFLAEINRTCRPALTAAHTQWRGLMGEAQHLGDDYLAEVSSRMSAYAANLADPDAHRQVMLTVEGLERATYAALVQQAQFWTTSERFYDAYCVTPAEVQVPAAPADVPANASDSCADGLNKISIAATLGPTKLKISCEQVKQELAVDVLPALQAFGEVSLNFRTGKVTFFAGSKFKQGLGPAEAQFKSGIYLSTDGRGGISDVGWRVGGEVKASRGPYEVSVVKDYQDLSFVGAFSTTP